MAKGPAKTLFKDAVCPMQGVDSDHQDVHLRSSDLQGLPEVIGVGVGGPPSDLFSYIQNDLC